MVDNLEEFLPLVNAFNELIDDLVVSGGLAQYFYLGVVHRKITDIDLLLEKEISIGCYLKWLNKLLDTDYRISSMQSKKDGCSFKLVSTKMLNHKNKSVRHFTSIDMKYKKELYEELSNGLKIIRYEQLLSNKVAASLIGDNVTHYLRVKDLYDLSFLLEKEDFDFELFIYLLVERLKNNGINNIFRTYLFHPLAEKVYLEYFEQMKNRYGMYEEADLFKVKKFLYTCSEKINDQIW